MKQRSSLPPAHARLPDPSNVDMSDGTAVRGFLTSLTSALIGHLNQRPPAGTAQDSRIFKAPDGKNWMVSVAVDGTLVSEPVGSVQDSPVPPT